MPKFDIPVQLTGTDGNAFAIIGAVQRALREEGVPADVIATFSAEAMSGDYDHVLVTAMRWVEVL
jgi:menaquinone-dependent protoporphyrinogen IX oxidase